MSNNIKSDEVVKYIVNTLEPVSYNVLRSKFCGSKCSDESKQLLHSILLAEVNDGKIMHYKDHFYGASMNKGLMNSLEQDNGMLSDGSDISISSCESGDLDASLQTESHTGDSKDSVKSTDSKEKPKSKPKKKSSRAQK